MVSNRMLERETGLSVQTVKTLLKHLKSNPPTNPELTHQLTHRASVLTIENYNSLVCQLEGSNPPDNPEVTHPVTTQEINKNNKTLVSAKIRGGHG